MNTSAYCAEQRVTITITGLDKTLATNVLALLTLEVEKTNPRLTDARLRRLHKKAIKEIKVALQPFGYYQPNIEPSLTKTKQGWQASYHIKLGKPVRVTNIDISILGEGDNDPKLAKILAAFPLKKQDIFVHSRYEEGKRTILKSALNEGYINTNFVEHRVRVIVEKNAVEIKLVLATGIRYQFGPITFDDSVINEKLMAGFSNIKEGEHYSSEKLLDLQNKLFGSDYFSLVEATPETEQIEGRKIPISVNVEPGKRHRYTAGVGYATDTEIRGTLGYTNRRLNRKGHRFRSTMRYSSVRESLIFGYAIPFRNPRTDQWEITLSLINNKPDNDREEDSYILGLNRTVYHKKNWLITNYLNYRRDSYRIGSENGDTLLLMPGITFKKIVVEKENSFVNGYRLSLDLRGTHNAIASDISSFQPNLSGKIIFSITEKGRVLFRGEAATTLIDDFKSLPPSLRYYAGGDTSIRGYGYQRLSPKNNEGDRIGGKQKLVGSIEYDYRFLADWSAAAFFDTGNAFNSWDDLDLKQGAGVGIRWYTPVGPLRIDVAKPVNESNSDYRFHIVFGTEL